MTSRGLRHALRVLGYRAFYRLPGRWRRGLVRLGSPLYTVGAITLVRAAGQDLLLLLRQPPGYRWTLPGGLLKRNEHPATGAARELAEETGIEVDPGELRPGVPNAIVHPDGQWVDMVFDVDVPSDVDIKVDGAEVYEAVFHPLDALPPLTVATARLLAHYGIGPCVEHPEAVADPEATDQ